MYLDLHFYGQVHGLQGPRRTCPYVLPQVGFVVLCNMGLVQETLATVSAFIQLLLSVDLPVPDKMGALDEVFPTLHTHIGFLTCVSLLVLRKCQEVTEALPAGNTFK